MTAHLLALVPDQIHDLHSWEDLFRPLLASGKGRTAALRRIASDTGTPYGTVRRKFYAYQEQGLTGVVNKRHCAALWQGGRHLSEADKQLVGLWCEKFQRNSAAAVRALRRCWKEQRLSLDLAARGLSVPHTDTALNPATGFPIGWSEGNLMRNAPSNYELKATRIGRSAAAAHRPLVYTTRANLYVGQFLMWDDMWHDHEVVDLDQRRRGRPLEFHGLDLASACKIAWGNRTRVERADGTHDGLKGGDFRFLLASFFAAQGYHPQGTTNIIEHGTTNVTEEIERILYDATGGLLTFSRGGMEGAAAHAGQYAGRSKGNFRFKAALESLGNLIHNEMAALPGQTGLDRQHAPEEQHGRQRHTDALLMALSQIAPERIEWLQWDYCTIAQFRLIADEVYARMNRREEHALEGWDQRWVPDRATGRMRRMSPWEVWVPGRRALRPLPEPALALLLGHEHGTERLTRNGMIELRDGEISGDLLRFDATRLPDREKFLTVVNPFDASRLWCYDARGRFVMALPRIHSVCRADIEAVQREMGRAAKTEAALLQPLRLRHLAEAREKLARHEDNAAVLEGFANREEQKAAESERRGTLRDIDRRVREGGEAALEILVPAPAPAADREPEEHRSTQDADSLIEGIL